jgi:hypothetical protein
MSTPEKNEGKRERCTRRRGNPSTGRFSAGVVKANGLHEELVAFFQLLKLLRSCLLAGAARAVKTLLRVPHNGRSVSPHFFPPVSASL